MVFVLFALMGKKEAMPAPLKLGSCNMQSLQMYAVSLHVYKVAESKVQQLPVAL